MDYYISADAIETPDQTTINSPEHEPYTEQVDILCHGACHKARRSAPNIFCTGAPPPEQRGRKRNPCGRH